MLDLSADVRAAAERIRSGVRRTATVRSRAFSSAIGGDVFLKMENRQTTGSYKERGALNAMLMLSPDARERGVVTMSAGNHAAAVAYHGGRLGLRTTVVMPATTPFLKVRRTRAFGADVILYGETFDDAAVHARDVAQRTGGTVIHPYDDRDVIAGQATATLELLEDAGTELDVLVVPVGGGGLIAVRRSPPEPPARRPRSSACSPPFIRASHAHARTPPLPGDRRLPKASPSSVWAVFRSR